MPAVIVTRSFRTEFWKQRARGNLNTTRIYEVVVKRSFIRTPCKGCMPICSMNCSVFADFLATLAPDHVLHGWVDENVERLISMSLWLFSWT